MHQCHQQLNYPTRPANRLTTSCGHLSSACLFRIAPPHPHHLPQTSPRFACVWSRTLQTLQGKQSTGTASQTVLPFDRGMQVEKICLIPNGRIGRFIRFHLHILFLYNLQDAVSRVGSVHLVIHGAESKAKILFTAGSIAQLSHI